MTDLTIKHLDTVIDMALRWHLIDGLYKVVCIGTEEAEHIEWLNPVEIKALSSEVADLIARYVPDNRPMSGADSLSFARRHQRDTQYLLFETDKTATYFGNLITVEDQGDFMDDYLPVGSSSYMIDKETGLIAGHYRAKTPYKVTELEKYYPEIRLRLNVARTLGLNNFEIARFITNVAEQSAEYGIALPEEGLHGV